MGILKFLVKNQKTNKDIYIYLLQVLHLFKLIKKCIHQFIIHHMLQF